MLSEVACSMQPLINITIVCFSVSAMELLEYGPNPPGKARYKIL
eukprot:COSAG06_NODE_56311_length_285_cov_1.021505_1_plen_43_part_01